MKKRIIGLLLCLAMCVPLLPVSAMAAGNPVKITKVAITGVPTPIDGVSTAISASNVTITTEPANAVTVADISWYEYIGPNTALAGKTFTAGKKYCLGLDLSPKDGYYFEWDNSEYEFYTGEVRFDGDTRLNAWSSYTVKDALYTISNYKIATLPAVYVNGQAITKDNLTVPCGSGTATYEPATKTLTLNGATITQVHSGILFGGIYAEQDLKINVVGDSSINVGTLGEGIFTTGNLVITGDKALRITTENRYSTAMMVLHGDLTVDMDGDLTARSAGTCLFATGDINISGNGSKTLTGSSKEKGLYSTGADITLAGGGNVTIEAGEGIYSEVGNVTLSGKGEITSEYGTAVTAGKDITIGKGYGIAEPENNKVSTIDHRATIIDKDNGGSSAGHVVIAPVCTVTFNMNGRSTQIPAQTVIAGRKASKPADPTSSGYTFGGWYADGTFSTGFNFNSAITTNTMVYAKWTKNSDTPIDPIYPQTGDNSNMLLLTVLLFVSSGALVGTAVWGKKRKRVE